MSSFPTPLANLPYERRNKLFLKTMSVDIEFRFLGNKEVEQKLSGGKQRCKHRFINTQQAFPAYNVPIRLSDESKAPKYKADPLLTPSLGCLKKGRVSPSFYQCWIQKAIARCSIPFFNSKFLNPVRTINIYRKKYLDLWRTCTLIQSLPNFFHIYSSANSCEESLYGSAFFITHVSYCI